MTPEIKLDNSLEKAIVKEIAFFDLFDYPLTAYEIWENLGQQHSLEYILSTLEDSSSLIAEKNGFYFLSGRREIIITRQKRYNYSYRKIKIARRFASLFSILPFIRMIAVANSLGQYNLRDGSDIDFFIISAPRRLWLSRLYCTGLAKILNCRPTIKTKKDKICLSFYLAEDHLDISNLHLSGSDPYFDHWRQNLILLYNKNKTSERFLEANGLTEKNKRDSFAGCLFRPSFFFSLLENIAKKIQLKIMPSALAAAMNNSDGVVINDSILKLYREDRRRNYAEKYGKKINEIYKENS